MRQRPSIAFPKPPAQLGNHDLAHFMMRYMLSSGNVEIPVMFFDKDELNLTLTKAYTADNVLKLEDEKKLKETAGSEESPVNSVATLTVMAMQQPTGCILEFDNKNALCVVGSGSSFYMIDVCNGVFYNTNGPEYDIQTYVDEYGSDHFKLTYFTVEDQVAEKPAPKKKRKTATTVAK